MYVDVCVCATRTRPKKLLVFFLTTLGNYYILAESQSVSPLPLHMTYWAWAVGRTRTCRQLSIHPSSTVSLSLSLLCCSRRKRCCKTVRRCMRNNDMCRIIPRMMIQTTPRRRGWWGGGEYSKRLTPCCGCAIVSSGLGLDVILGDVGYASPLPAFFFFFFFRWSIIESAFLPQSLWSKREQEKAPTCVV